MTTLGSYSAWYIFSILSRWEDGYSNSFHKIIRYKHIIFIVLSKRSKVLVDVKLIQVKGIMNATDKGAKIMKGQLAKKEIKIEFENTLAT